MSNCLSCAKYFSCKDPHKSGAWICELYQDQASAHVDDLKNELVICHTDVLSELNNPDIEALPSELDSWDDLSGMVDAAIQSNSLMPIDLEVDDRWMWEAPNYYEFCFSGKGIKFQPFARQLWLAAMTFMEVCPRCSNHDWFNDINNVPVDYPAKEMPEHFVFLENGVCPKCGGGKADFIKAKEIKNVMELSVCLGQRSGKCLRGNTLIPTELGMKYIVELRPKNAKVGEFVDFNIKLKDKNGRDITTSRYYVNPPEMIYRITFSDGSIEEATGNHKIWTEEGFVKVSDLRTGLYVPKFVGQNIWGSDIPNAKEAAEKANRLLSKSTCTRPIKRDYYSGDLSLDDCRLLGLWVAEGSANAFCISNHDQNVISFINRGISRWTGRVALSDTVICNQSRKPYDNAYIECLLGSNGYSAERHVPPSIMSAPKEYVAAFLQGYFEGDGGWDNGDVMCGSLSERLIREVSALLNNFGIMHTIRTKKTWATNGSKSQVSKDFWEIYIVGKALFRFKKEIDFMEGSWKRDRLRARLRQFKGRSQKNPVFHDFLPFSLKPRLNAFFEMVVRDVKKHKKPSPYKGKFRMIPISVNDFWNDRTPYKGLRFHNIQIKRTQIRKLLSTLKSHKHYLNYLSKETLKEANYWASFSNSDSKKYYCTIKSIEQIGVEEAYDFEVPNVHRYMTGNGVLNHNSIFSSSILPYHLHKVLKMVRPTEYYGLASSTPLTGTYVGLTLGRATNLLWRPIRSTIMDSPWFREYFKFLSDEGNRIGIDLLTVKETFINFRRSNLLISPAAPDSGKLRGDTRIQGSVDEIGFFRFGSGSEDLVTISADEIHTSITNSLATVRTKANKLIKAGIHDFQQGLMVNLSSPSSVFDKIMTLVRQSEHSNTMIGVRLPTWEVNPDITEEDLEHYKVTLGRERFERDFGANPPLGDSPYFEPDTIAPIFNGKRNAVSYEYEQRTNKREQPERSAVIKHTYPMASQPPALMAIDAGETNNSFSLAIGIPSLKGTEHPADYIRGTVRKKNPRLSPVNGDLQHRVTIQALIEIIPPKDGRVNFKRVYNRVIVPLIQAFNVKVVVADRWNSILMLDSLKDDLGIDAFQYSLRYNDFTLIRDMVETDNYVSLPRTESKFETISNFQQRAYPYCFEGRPIDHLSLQFLTVKDYGRTVGKGSGLTDDTFRSVALALFFLGNVQFVYDYLSGESKRKAPMGIGAIAGGNEVATTVPSSVDPRRGIAAIGNGGGGDMTVFARKK